MIQAAHLLTVTRRCELLDVARSTVWSPHRVADLGGDTLHRPLRGLRSGAQDHGREALDLPAPGHDERFWRCGHRRLGAGRPAVRCARRGPW